MGTPYTWQFYSKRRRGLTIEKFVETQHIKSIEELRQKLSERGVAMPGPELLKDLFKPEWTGKYPKEVDAPAKGKSVPKGTNRAKSRLKKQKSKPEKKSTYLQAAYQPEEESNTDEESKA